MYIYLFAGSIFVTVVNENVCLSTHRRLYSTYIVGIVTESVAIMTTPPKSLNVRYKSVSY